MVAPLMMRLALTAMVFAAMQPAASAAPRFALVRVKDIYTKRPSTAEQQSRVRKEREEIMKAPRAADLRRIIKELEGLQERLSDKNNPPAEEAGRKLAQTYEIKRQEAQTLQKEFESFRAEREKEINRRMVAEMRSSLNRIVETTRRLAKERGFDLVLDSSGGTNTGVPFVLHSARSTDLTDDVVAALDDADAAMQSKPADPPPAPSARPNR